MKLLRWQWRGILDLPKFQRAFEGLADFSRQNRISGWLADTSDMPIVGIDEQAWLSEKWLPNFARLGVSKIGLVLPLSLHNMLVVEHLVYDAQRHLPGHVQFFSDTAAAFDWLTDSSPRIPELELEWPRAESAAAEFRPQAAWIT